jgi:hypothetical protein
VYSRIVLYGSIGVIAFDIFASLASRAFGFWYPYATVGSWLIYGVVGFFAGRASSVKAASVAGGTMGFVDSTLGWAASWHIGPGNVGTDTVTAGSVLFVIIIVILTGMIIGAICGALGRRSEVRAARVA